MTKISRFPLLCILFNLALFVASNSTAQSAQGGFKDSANSPNAATRVEAVEILATITAQLFDRMWRLLFSLWFARTGIVWRRNREKKQAVMRL